MLPQGVVEAAGGLPGGGAAGDADVAGGATVARQSRGVAVAGNGHARAFWRAVVGVDAAG